MKKYIYIFLFLLLPFAIYGIVQACECLPSEVLVPANGARITIANITNCPGSPTINTSPGGLFTGDNGITWEYPPTGTWMDRVEIGCRMRLDGTAKRFVDGGGRGACFFPDSPTWSVTPATQTFNPRCMNPVFHPQTAGLYTWKLTFWDLGHKKQITRYLKFCVNESRANQTCGATPSPTGGGPSETTPLPCWVLNQCPLPTPQPETVIVPTPPTPTTAPPAATPKSEVINDPGYVPPPGAPPPAGGIPPAAIIPVPAPTGGTMGQLIAELFSWSLRLLGLSVFAMILYGGFEWLTAAGNPGRISKAKGHIWNALLGAILLLSSLMILRILSPQFVSGT